jgi:hypothetical protein
MLDMRTVYERAVAGLSDAGTTAKDNPKTTAALVAGAMLAAAALWVLREPQRLSAARKKAVRLLGRRFQ